MQIEGYVQALRDDLVRVAAVGDESTARAAELLAVALESSLGRRLQEALGEAALELSSQLDSGRIEVRIAGGDPELVLVRDDGAAAAEPADEAFTARITLRLPESLKGRLEAAADPRRSLRQHVARAHAPSRIRAARPQRWQSPPPHRLRPELRSAVMSDILIRASIPSDARWSYDDPSGVPEPPLAVRVPETLRGGVERAAARDGPHAPASG